MKMMCLLSLLVLVATSQAFTPPLTTRTITSSAARLSAAATIQNSNLLVDDLLGDLSSLIKASKTKTVILELDALCMKMTKEEIGTRSMQLRKLGAAGIATNDVTTARYLVEEQATAKGDFPGPALVIYTGKDVEAAVQAGVSAILSETSTTTTSACAVPIIHKVSPDIERMNSGDTAVLFEVDSTNIDAISQLSNSPLIIASLESMQNDQQEVILAKALAVPCIFIRQAILGDKEDLVYAEFVLSGITKKRSSTFNLTGLTGSTNGHFGGIASPMSRTWLRKKQQQ
jgi:hypothetical protein